MSSPVVYIINRFHVDIRYARQRDLPEEILRNEDPGWKSPVLLAQYYNWDTYARIARRKNHHMRVLKEIKDDG